METVYSHTMYPAYTRGERLADACIHAVGVVGGVVAVTVLLVAAIPTLPASTTLTVAIYGAAMIAMFGCSAAYHLVPAPDWKSLLRRLDQAAIFLKIAGTYTPFALIKIGGPWGYSVFGAVWIAALAGATAKLILTSNWDGVSVILYVALGWAGIIILQPLVGSVSLTTIILLGSGGVLYTLGVVFHLWNSLPYQNAIWHLFVLAGTACHYAAVSTAIFE